MKTTLKVLAVLFALSTAASAQVAPAVTGPGRLPANGRLYYAFRYAQSAEFGGTLGTWQMATASGSANYASTSERAPFSVEYAGGYAWTLTGPSFGSGLFQRMNLAQGGVWRKWAVTVSDDVSYSPQSPFTGFSGITGIGEPIGTPNPTPPSSQSILTLNTHVVENLAMGTVENKLTAATTLSGSGAYNLLRYPNNDGLDTNTYSANGQLTHRLNGRDSIIGTYQYSLYTYPNYSYTFETHAGLFGFRYLLSRKLSAVFAAGPLWINGSTLQVGSTLLVIPSKLTYTANGKVAYTSKPTSVDVGYSHGTNGGAGYLFGATWDSVEGNFSRIVGPNLMIGLTGGYNHTAALINNTTVLINTGATNNVVGGSQATWQINRNVIAFVNYTGAYQTTTSPLPTNAVNQVLQTVSFGVGFSPRNTHFKQ
jgi:hypothetical protein